MKNSSKQSNNPRQRSSMRDWWKSILLYSFLVALTLAHNSGRLQYEKEVLCVVCTHVLTHNFSRCWVHHLWLCSLLSATAPWFESIEEASSWQPAALHENNVWACRCARTSLPLSCQSSTHRRGTVCTDTHTSCPVWVILFHGNHWVSQT